MTRARTVPAQPLKRCAIYTRRSLDPDIFQDFTSLDNQRQICSSYIASQQHKSWTELPQQYADSGYSGASLRRPALQDLLRDVEDGLIDVVVVYKLDRITRTLIDFVRLVDFFEAHGVVFVSITQNFDTADSLGRLILNVLLTFAQFEREMASDRIRDKIANAKKAGHWTGGPAPLGYDNVRGRLRVNSKEARLVARIFTRYVETGTMDGVYRELHLEGVRSKRWKTRAGKMIGGGPITKSSVYHILGNPVYIGEVVHRDKTYPGLHDAIIDRALWDKAQEIRANTARSPYNPHNLLRGLLFDPYGRPMCCMTRVLRGKGYRYYVSGISAWARRRGLRRMTAHGDGLEELVLATLQEFLSDRPRIRPLLLRLGFVGADLDSLSTLGVAAAQRLAALHDERRGLTYRALLSRIELSPERVKLVIRCEEIARFLAWDGVGFFKKDDFKSNRGAVCEIVDVPASVVRFRKSFPIPIEARPANSVCRPNRRLVSLIEEARKVQALVDTDRELEPDKLAAKASKAPWAFSRLLKLNYLAPDIITSILDGTQPPSLTKTMLMTTELPMDWALQRRLLGFPERPALAQKERIDCTNSSGLNSFSICARSDLRSDQALNL
jgi:site-specific DNA recombinase